MSGMEAYMKKAVLMIMVTLFAGSAFASAPACSKKTSVGMFSATKASGSSTSGATGSEGTR